MVSMSKCLKVRTGAKVRVAYWGLSSHHHWRRSLPPKSSPISIADALAPSQAAISLVLFMCHFCLIFS